MFALELSAFLALLGVVAFAVPWVILRSAPRLHPAGLLLAGLGCVALLSCVRDFYVTGKETLAP